MHPEACADQAGKPFLFVVFHFKSKSFLPVLFPMIGMLLFLHCFRSSNVEFMIHGAWPSCGCVWPFGMEMIHSMVEWWFPVMSNHFCLETPDAQCSATPTNSPPPLLQTWVMQSSWAMVIAWVWDKLPGFSGLVPAFLWISWLSTTLLPKLAVVSLTGFIPK